MSRKHSDPPSTVPDPDLAPRHAVLARFKLEDIQHLNGDDLAAAQQLCGHGATPGQWETDTRKVAKHLRNIPLAMRIRSALRTLDPGWLNDDHADLVTEGVLTLTQLGVLARLVPVFGKGSKKSRTLNASTVCRTMHGYWATLAAHAIQRKATAATSDPGLFRYLIEADLHGLGASERLSPELARLDTLTDRGLWWDVPDRKPLPTVTDPSSKPPQRGTKRKPIPHPPFPMDWLAEIGPRVLWTVTELAPNLLRLLERLREPMKDADVWKANWTRKVSAFIVAEQERTPWLDATGRPLVPPFPLQTASGSGGGGRADIDRYDWPIRTWEQVMMLSTTIQAAHAFIALLATAGRVVEDATLNRACMEVHADGSPHVHGRTYKLNWAPDGKRRSWPAPAMLVTALGQQARLAAAWDWLPLTMECGGAPNEPQFGDQLWVSIGNNGQTGPDADFHWQGALMSLARRLGVTDKPGGKNVHPHRFRKTTSKLAGIALWNSPIVLKQLLGHKDIEMTLHYILSDPGIREEAEKVLRELRVMHCADTLQQVRKAVKAGLPNPFGGIGGTRLASAVTEHEARETDAQRTWTTDTPYNLAVEYTMNGLGWRLGIGFICSKLPHEAGDCRRGASRRSERGEPLISNCQRTCTQRVELPDQIAHERKRRDVEEVCDGYIAIASQACEEGQLLVAAGCLQQINDELAEWPELKARYDARSDVQALVATLEPVEEAEAVYG